jgi:hypothetical protein
LSAADRLGIALFLALWGSSVAYLGATGGDWTFPFVSLGVFGLALSAIALFATRGANLVLLHACVDVLPNLSEFIKVWRLS